MHEWGDSGITAILLAIGIAFLLSFVLAQQARNRAARYKEIRRLQSVAAEEARREEEEARAEYTSMVATRNYCAVCSNPTINKCSRCKAVRYCSSACQIQHWTAGHKRECRPPGPVPSPGSSSNGSRNFSDVFSSNGSSVSGSRTLSEVSEVHNVEDGTQAELVRTAPAWNGNGTLQRPKKILFPYDYFVKFFNWERLKVPPCGLLNCGNSCFANVVLQCLTYTRPLTGYLLEGSHGEECRRNDWCFMCELQDHVWRVRQSQNPFSPIRILSRIRNIGNHLGYGRQEDAHEFMRFAIDSMQSICLDEAGGEKSVDPRSQETTFIHYTFGGHLQSQVKCMQCLHESNRYENMMDLAVEIQGCVETLEDALTQFTAPELLDGENMYKCDRCNAYVKARKRLTLHEAPNILTIALKRFQSGKFGKLNKRVTFPEVLDVSPYMSGKGDMPPLYRLYAVVVHVDMLNASFFGHYICYVKDSQGLWYKIDDGKVKEVDIEKVLAQRAYMLFYARSLARPPPSIDGAVSPYQVAGTTGAERVRSQRHGSVKLFPASQYPGSKEILEGGGAQGLHAMVDFNQMLDYVDGNTETVSGNMLSNGEIAGIHQCSWERERIRSTTPEDDETESEDAGRMACSSSLTQTSPYMSSFTSTQGLWIPTQGFVCQVPESSQADVTEYDLKSSLPDDFSEVSLQPSTEEILQSCTAKIGKRRLEDGLSPLPTPRPLDTDQLPAWPTGSQGICPPPVKLLSGIPLSLCLSDESYSLQQQCEEVTIAELSPLGTYPLHHLVSSDLVYLPLPGQPDLDPEMTDYTIVESTESQDEDVAARAKRQHVEIDSGDDPTYIIPRPDEMFQSKALSTSSASGLKDMDWDETTQQSVSLTSGVVFGPLPDSCKESQQAAFHNPELWGSEELKTQPQGETGGIDKNSFSNPESLGSERLKTSLPRHTNEVEESEVSSKGTIVKEDQSGSLKLVTELQCQLQEKVVASVPCHVESTTQDQASSSVDQEVILEKGVISHKSDAPLPKEPALIKDATVQTNYSISQASSGSAPPAVDKPQVAKLQKSKSVSKPLFAPGFLNKTQTPTRPKIKSISNAATKASSMEKGSVEKFKIPVLENAKDHKCSYESHLKDTVVTPEGDQVCPPKGGSIADGNEDTLSVLHGKIRSRGNCMNCELCNSAQLDSRLENGPQTAKGTAPDVEDKYLANMEGRNDFECSLHTASQQNVGVNGSVSSLDSPPVKMDAPNVESVNETGGLSGRLANGKQKQGRNETCNCGSQRKWKKCCGKTGVIKPEVGRMRLVV